MRSFLQTKQEFDSKCSSQEKFVSFVPVHLKLGNIYSIKDKRGKPNEEYYKWQFFCSLIYSGLYPKDYVGCEVYFPKGNKNSAPIKLDGAIFDDREWFDWYKKFHNDRDQKSLDRLRKHLIGVIEFKKEDSKDIENVYNQQLKSYLKESENSFCLGIIYDAERLYLFQKKNENYLRLDESYNLKKDESRTKDLSLHLTDAYYKIPSLDQLRRRITRITVDRTKRTIDDLDVITGIYSRQLEEGISQILVVMDKVGMKNQRGYETLIQILALKIFDEKRSLNAIPKEFLEVYKSESETEKLNLLSFYITEEEKRRLLGNEQVQNFINRIRGLYNEASDVYHYILEIKDTGTIIWDDASYIQVISEVVEQFQDYSFVKSHKTDLYQIVFYRFANEFVKAEKGQFLTPIALIDFLVKIVNPRGDEKIIDPTMGIADFLSISYVNAINSNDKLDDNNIYGLDIEEML